MGALAAFVAAVLAVSIEALGVFRGGGFAGNRGFGGYHGGFGGYHEGFAGRHGGIAGLHGGALAGSR